MSDVERVLYAAWTGSNPMSKDRRACFDTLSNAGVEVRLVTEANVDDYAPDRHQAYEYLSSTHRADYLRCYLMHHRGGGYSDIKRTSHSWVQAFRDLEESDAWLNGYPEVGPEAVAKVGGKLEQTLRDQVHRLPGCGAIICRPGTPLTQEWMDGVHAILDRALPDLVEHPATDHADFKGKLNEVTFEASQYPLAWTEILGNVFHPLCLKHVDRILRTVPMFRLVAYK